MRWEQAWQEALYGPKGFYRRHAPAEHFATSAQGVPGAGEVLAEAVVALARRHGCREVVDVGAGRGELLAQVAALAPDLRLTGVDVVDRRPPGVHRWLLSPGGAELPEELVHLTDALVVAHEWLDVVPCPVVERDEHGVWGEVTVLLDGTESSRPVSPRRASPSPVSSRRVPSSARASSPGRDAEILDWLGRWVPGPVVRAEVGLPRDRAAADLLGRIDRGVLLAVDYGHLREDRPVHGTLTGFRGGREVLPVPDGTCDLTAHVAVDSLVEHLADAFPGTPCQVSTQAEALTDLLPGAGAPVPHELARREPATYLEALARRGALATLRAPDGPGGFHWLVLPRQ